jgi:hypothetical protein
MVQWALATLQQFPRWPVKMTLSSEHLAAIQAAAMFGFQKQQTLITMRHRAGDVS